MDLTKEVCEIEYAKRLKELGIKQESNYCYAKSSTLIDGVWSENIITFTHREITNSPDSWSAFTASELIADLPNTITLPYNEPFNNFLLYIRKLLMVEESNEIFSVYSINYDCDTFDLKDSSPWLSRKLFMHSIYDKNFANSLAKTKIYLIENKLL